VPEILPIAKVLIDATFGKTSTNEPLTSFNPILDLKLRFLESLGEMSQESRFPESQLPTLNVLEFGHLEIRSATSPRAGDLSFFFSF